MDNSFYMDDFYLGDLREDVIAVVKKIAVNCPKKGPLPNCPLYIFNDLSLTDKLVMVDSLPLEQLEYIIQHHYGCYR